MSKLPKDARIAVLIRDDDTSAVTPIPYLQTVYETAWSLGFPVSLATVPEIMGSHNLNLPPQLRGSGDIYPLGQVPELVKFLKERREGGHVEIMQHGRYHTTDLELRYPKFGSTEGYDRSFLKRSSEFYGAGAAKIRADVQAGKAELERLFGPVTSFVAPQEHLTPALWQVLVDSGFIGYSGGMTPKFWEHLPVGAVRPSALARLTAAVARRTPLAELGEYVVPLTRLPMIPASVRVYWSGYRTEEEMEVSVERALAVFKRKYERGDSYFLILTHYWEYFGDWQENVTQPYQLEGLNRILKAIDGYDHVWKCTMSDFARLQA